MKIVKQGFTDLVGALAGAFRVLWEHWPNLLALFFAGAALRGGFLWLAVWVSEFSGLLAMLLLPFASLSMLVAMVLMLRVAGRSFPALRENLELSRGMRIRRNLTLAVQMLIPFLALYAAQGMIKADLRLFFHNATADEWMNEGFNADFGRALFASDTTMIVIVVAALILRKTIAGFGLAEKSPRMAGFAGYLEALWLVTLASFFTWSLDTLREWVATRKVTQSTLDGIDEAIALVFADTQVFTDLLGTFGSWLGSLGGLIIVPVAWIAVGATVYGASLPAAKPLLTSEQATKRLEKIPNPVKRTFAQVTEPVVTPVSNTMKAISRIAVAGVIPMVFLCVLFVLISQVRVLVTEGLRLLLGPHDGNFWFMATPYVDLAATACYTTLMVALLAVTVNQVVLGQRRILATEQEEAASA